MLSLSLTFLLFVWLKAENKDGSILRSNSLISLRQLLVQIGMWLTLWHVSNGTTGVHLSIGKSYHKKEEELTNTALRIQRISLVPFYVLYPRRKVRESSHLSHYYLRYDKPLTLFNGLKEDHKVPL